MVQRDLNLILKIYKHCVRLLPLIFQNVEANCTSYGADVWMPNLCDKLDLHKRRYTQYYYSFRHWLLVQYHSTAVLKCSQTTK